MNLQKDQKHSSIKLVSEKPNDFEYTKTKLLFICDTHGEFDSTGRAFVNRKYRCVGCSGAHTTCESFVLKLKTFRCQCIIDEDF